MGVAQHIVVSGTTTNEAFHANRHNAELLADILLDSSCVEGKHPPITELLSQKYRLTADFGKDFGRWFKVVYAFDEIGIVR